jgi:hypothetical protein
MDCSFKITMDAGVARKGFSGMILERERHGKEESIGNTEQYCEHWLRG